MIAAENDQPERPRRLVSFVWSVGAGASEWLLIGSLALAATGVDAADVRSTRSRSRLRVQVRLRAEGRDGSDYSPATSKPFR